MAKDEVPEECVQCPRTVKAVQQCGRTECLFKLSPLDRAKKMLELQESDSPRALPSLDMK